VIRGHICPAGNERVNTEAVVDCAVYLCVSYGYEKSDCSYLLRGPRIQRQAS